MEGSDLAKFGAISQRQVHTTINPWWQESEERYKYNEDKCLVWAAGITIHMHLFLLLKR